MAIQSTWLDDSERDRLSDIRLRCYGDSPADRAKFQHRTQFDRIDAGDALILSDPTGDLATATAMSLRINVRGTVLPCQGVAWVGSVRSHRRRKINGHGLATHAMRAMLSKARERGQVVSMLSPFRVSFYETFGYGIVERQNVWTIPLSILPKDDNLTFSEATDTDFGPMLASRQRQFQQAHGDIETDERSLRHWLENLSDSGFRMVDRQADRIASQFTLGSEIEAEQAIAVVHRPWWDSMDALRRLLCMLGTLRDQYSLARITLPTDLPIGWWLSERQQAHRRVDHPAAMCRTITRMQARILDHVRFLNAVTVPEFAKGSVTVRIDECDSTPVLLRLEFDQGRVIAKPTSGEADVSMSDVAWASIAFGDQRASVLTSMGLIHANGLAKVAILDALGAQSLPYCHEYF